MKFLFFLLSVLLLASCNSSHNTHKKQQDSANIDSLLLVQHTEILTALGQQTQKFTINIEKEQQIKGLNGTIIIIQKDCFDAKEIILELVECYSKLDFIKNALSTVTSDGRLLESQGMLYLNVTDKQGNVLKPKVGKLSVKVPVETDTECKFFNGMQQKSTIVWRENPQVVISKVKSAPKMEQVRYPQAVHGYIGKNGQMISDTIWNYQYKEVVTSMNAFYSMFNPDSLGWYNLDRYEESERIDFVANNTINEACVVIMIPQELNTVLHCAPSMEYNQTGLKIKKIPNLNADFLFLRFENDSFYYDLVVYKKGDSRKLKIDLKSIEKEELNNLLKKHYGKKFTNEVSV